MGLSICNFHSVFYRLRTTSVHGMLRIIWRYNISILTFACQGYDNFCSITRWKCKSQKASKNYLQADHQNDTVHRSQKVRCFVIFFNDESSFSNWSVFYFPLRLHRVFSEVLEFTFTLLFLGCTGMKIQRYSIFKWI